MKELMDMSVEKAVVLTPTIMTRELRDHLTDNRKCLLDNLDPILELIVKHTVKDVG